MIQRFFKRLIEKFQRVFNWFDKRSAVVMTIVAIIMCISLFQNHESLDQTKESLKMNRESLELQKHDLYLTHKPIVFVKIPPTRPDANSNPLKDTFFLTNTGKLPAKNVTVSIIIDKVVGGMAVFDNLQAGTPMLEQTTLYPGDDLFLVQDMISIGGDVSKAQITFIIKYKGQGIEGEMTEKMKFIYKKDIAKWLHVGPKYDIFSKERKEFQERMRELNWSDTGSK